MVAQRALDTFANLVVLVAVPLLLYYVYHRLRHQRGLRDVLQRAGFRLGSSEWGYPDSVDRVSSAVRSVCFFSSVPMESGASAATAAEWSRAHPWNVEDKLRCLA